MLKQFEHRQEKISQKGLRRSRITTRPLPQGKILISDKEHLNFCSSDYLGLSVHPHIKKAMQLSMEQNGFGSSSSPLLSGYSEECEALKKAFCQRLGFEDALIFPSGYQANIDVLAACLARNSTALCDRFCHASIYDGLILARARIKRFRHNDVCHARDLITTSPPDLFIMESVFSMEGDVAPMDDMASLCQSHNIPIFLDDAHGFGVFGHDGLGAINHWKFTKKGLTSFPSLLEKP